jgi:hypothetical protein
VKLRLLLPIQKMKVGSGRTFFLSFEIYLLLSVKNSRNSVETEFIILDTFTDCVRESQGKDY